VANDVSARPWFIDTPGPGTLLGAGNNGVFVKFVEVVTGPNAPTQGNQAAIVTDKNGKQLVSAFYQTAVKGEIQTYNLENWFENIIVPTLDTVTGTTLRIHVK